MAPDLSCRYADVVVPSYSTITRLLPYGLTLSSSTTGRAAPAGPPRATDSPGAAAILEL